MTTSFFDKLRTKKDLNYLVPELAKARALQTQHEADLKKVQAEVDALVQEKYGNILASIQALVDSAKADVEELDAQVRIRAVADFEASGDKRPHPAVSVGEYTVLDYDLEVALQWGIQFGACVKLDKREFEKAAKALGNLEFVKINTEPCARINADLEAYLER